VQAGWPVVGVEHDDLHRAGLTCGDSQSGVSLPVVGSED